MKRQTILSAYKACLRLYPAAVRHRYAEQMYLTAKDMLADSSTSVETAHVAVWLVCDMAAGLVKTHAKQLQGVAMKKSSVPFTTSVSRAIGLGLQVVAVPTLAYVCVLPVISFLPTSPYEPLQYVIGELVLLLLPILMVLISFRVLSRLRLNAWNHILAALVIGSTAGMMFYWSESRVMYQLWPYLGSIHQPFAFLYDWLAMGLYMALFYVAGSRIASRVIIAPAGK